MRLLASTCGCFLLIISVQASAQTAPLTAARPTSAPVARSKASLEPILQQGADALAAGQLQAARASFLDALAIDPRNAKAYHGLGLCYLQQKENGKARDLLDKTLTLTTTPDRAMVLNAAAANLAIKNQMRAAKLTKDYLAARPKELDEPMLNALGTALSKATATERKNRFFQEFAAFYIIANQRMEATRPGYKRFGMEWYPANEANAKSAAMALQQKDLDRLSDEIATAEERLVAADKELARQKDLALRGEGLQNYYLQAAQANYDMCKANLQSAQDRYEKLAGSLERPKFPPEILTVAMDETTAPPLSKPVIVVADATPVTPSINPTPRTPRIPRPTPNTTPKTPSTTPNPPTVDNPPAVAVVTPRPPRKVRVTQYAAAFPVAPALVVTSAAVIQDGATLQLQSSDGQSLSARLVRKDEATGLALLKLEGRRLAPLSIADAFTGGPIACAAFPTVDLFSPAAQSITGTAAVPKDNAWTVSLGTHPRLAGSPILSGGKVIGVVIAPRDAEKTKLPAVPLDALKTFLGSDVQPAGAPGDPATSLLQLITTTETTSAE